ncbi:MAG: hypothetical protein JRJ27_17245 [Deltaproteobacteria bacterium]|nr:hypothetical protein [Deltaproteobacteria bacterium]
MEKAATEKEVSSTDLVLADKLEPAVLFGNEHKTLEDLLSKIKKEVSTIVPDVTTAKGRKAITANVSRITKSKTTLDKAGKDYNAAQKELLKTFDKQRKYAFTFLEDLQKEVRKPLTEWEDKEKDRIAKCEGVVNAFILAGNDSENWMNYTAEELADLLKTVEDVTITRRLAEFEDEAQQAKHNAVKNINTAIQSRVKYDNDQAELKEMREKIAEQDRKNFEADQRAETEREARKKVIEANTAREAAEKEADRVVQQAKDYAKEVEKQKQIDLENAEKQRVIDAENAEKQRLIDVEAAAQAERDRIEAEKQSEIEAEKKRAANKTHKGKINRAIVKELLKCGIDETQAKKIVTVIAQNKVPNVKISY